MTTILLLLASLTAIGRLLIEPRLNLFTVTGTYEALVHIFLGVMVGLAIAGKARRLSIWLLILLTAFEVGVFVGQKKGLIPVNIPGSITQTMERYQQQWNLAPKTIDNNR